MPVALVIILVFGLIGFGIQALYARRSSKEKPLGLNDDSDKPLK